MSRLRTGRPLWLDRQGAPRLRTPKLEGHHATDVAIVGGGITGCACAYLLASRGVRVALLDAGEIGHGSTAASTALLMQEPDLDFRTLAARHGTRTARSIWDQSRGAVRSLVRTARRLRIDADLRALPSIYVARSDEDARELRREAADRRRVDLPARWLSPHEVREIASIDAAGAILVTGNAQADPYRLCLGLARAARARGAALHARSRVRRTTSSADGVRLETSRGRIDAGHVIVATGYATPEFKPLAGRFRMYTTYVVTTPRLPAAVRGAIETNVMWWDTNRPYHYARWTSDGRLLFGGEDRRHGPGRARRGAIRTRAQTLMAGAAEMYPILQGVAPAYAWEGLFATTPDGLPYVGAHRRYPKHLFALGYGGNGMTLGFLAAQILQRTLRGRATAEDNLFAFGRDRHA